MSIQTITVTNSDGSIQVFTSSPSNVAPVVTVSANVPITIVDGGVNQGFLGTVSVNAGNQTVIGVSTNFTNLNAGSTITANGETHSVQSVNSATNLTTDAWVNTASNVPFTEVV